MCWRFFCLLFLLSSIYVVGCSDSTNAPNRATVESAAPAAFNIAGAPTVEFSVPDMMCPEGCGAKVKEILAEQPGAKDVLVDFPNKIAKVAVDKDKFDAKQAVAALVDHQFKNSALKDASAEVVDPKPQAAKATSVQ